MGHEIEKHDEVVLFQEPAWHGLGHVIPKRMRPTQLVREYEKLNYEVIQVPLYIEWEGEKIQIETHVANFRADIKEVMGIVGSTYQVSQNMEIAEFCEAIGKEAKDVVCETAGTIRNGRRIWFLCKAEAFEIGSGRKKESDVVVPYLCICNGHDGWWPVRGQPTTVRAVCSNTLHAVFPDFDNPGSYANTGFSIKHTTSVHDKIEEAKEALRTFRTAQEEMRGHMEKLAKAKLNTKKLAEFFVEQYQADFGAVDPSDDSRGGKMKLHRLESARESFTRRWDDEEQRFGANGWVAFNCYSGLIQHDRKAYGKDDADRVERRVESNLFGLNSERTRAAFVRALNALAT